MDSNALINDIMNSGNNNTFDFDPYGTTGESIPDPTPIDNDSAPEVSINDLKKEQTVIKAERVKKTQPQNNSQPVAVNSSIKTSIPTSITNLDIKKSYTDQEWEAREDLYIEECNKINVDPTNLTTSEISIAAGKIDAILTPLMIDNVYNQRQCGIYETQLKINEQLAYNTVKSNLSAQNVKATVNEVESMVTKTIYDNKSFEEGINIYDAINRYKKRAIFTKQIIDLMNGKKDLLITFSAVLKVENSVTNFIPNVPNESQYNNMKG